MLGVFGRDVLGNRGQGRKQLVPASDRHVEVVRFVGRGLVPELGIEKFELRGFDPQRGGERAQLGRVVDPDGVEFQRRVGFGEGEAVLGRILEDLDDGDEPGDVAGGLKRKPLEQIPEVVEVADVLRIDRPSGRIPLRNCRRPGRSSNPRRTNGGAPGT